MTNVINLEDTREKRGAAARLELKSQKERCVFLRSQFSFGYHPIVTNHREQGRTHYTNVEKKNVFEAITRAMELGFTDFVVEETALYKTPKGIKVLEGNVAIYAKRES